MASLVLLALSLGLPSALPAQVDSYYTSLLDRGGRDLASGRTAEAERKLRVASFGLLDQVDLLAECLVQLARAQVATGNQSGLRKTIGRLVEIETAFGAYSALEASTSKAAFEELVRVAATPELNRGRPLLSTAPVAPTETPDNRPAESAPPEAQASPAPAPEPPPSPAPSKEPSARSRRKALERSLAANPGDREALWELARLDLADGKPKRAVARLDRLLSEQPGDVSALCLRAEIAVPRNECAPVLAAFQACPTLLEKDETAAFVLECLASAGRNSDAGLLFATLPAERRASPALARAAERIAGLNATAPSAPDVRAEPRVSIALPLEERLRRIRATLDSARIRSDLAETMARGARLADEYPDSTAAQYLAAEIAFRSGDYPTAVEYFSRGGEPGAEQPVLLFFLSVSLFETEKVEDAERVLQKALPRLEASSPSPYVRSYIEKILGRSPL